MFDNSYKMFVEKYVATHSLCKNSLLVSEKELTKRIQDQQEIMPDYLGFGIKMVSWLFMVKVSFLQLRSYKNISITEFQNHVKSARNSNISLIRNLIRFHDSLFEVANVSEDLIRNVSNTSNIPTKSKFDFIIIGSGPGGAVSARKLQEAGFDTCILESGQRYIASEIQPFSYNEMVKQYKHSGITTTLGGANITYVEGMTFGGGSEVNSGLYHRTPNEVLKYWKKKFGLLEVEPSDLEKYFEVIEQDLCISSFPKGTIPAASLKLKYGASQLGWEVQEVPRWFKYNQTSSGDGEKMTMSKTYLMDYLENGGVVIERAKAQKLKEVNGNWNVYFDKDDKIIIISAKKVILSAGTIGTPSILQKSRLSKLAGKSFQMHPTIKVIALFDEKINEEGIGVPVHQVKEFAPDFSFGCSISSKPYLRVAMLDHPEYVNIVEEKLENMAIYYSMIVPEGSGSIKNLPFFKDPHVTYRLTNRDKNNLAQGLKKLCELLISAGANSLYPSIKGAPVITNINDINQLPESIDPANTSLMTVHLFSSCPIGERKDRCVANSFGKVFGHEDLFISDGSMLPSAPGVNPQGTIMAFAHRNIEKIIAEA